MGYGALLNGDKPYCAADMPPEIGSALPEDLRLAVHGALASQETQLGSVYRAMTLKPTAGPSALTPYTTCANSGAVGNLRSVIRAVTDLEMPNGPSRIGAASSSVRSLRKASVGGELRDWFDYVLSELDNTSGTVEGAEQEAVELKSDSEELSDRLKTATGVYVYTYPHYWRYPCFPGTERHFLKVGMTTKTAWTRVVDQVRETGMPEDPLLLRVYETDNPPGAERKFHKLLESADHERSVGVAVGREWFATSIRFCDAIAEALDLKVIRGSSGTA